MNVLFPSFYFTINCHVLKLLSCHGLFTFWFSVVWLCLDMVFLKFILFAFIEIFEICKSVSFTKFGNFSAIIFSNTFSAPIIFSFPSGTPITWVLDLQYCPSGPCSVSFLSSKGIMYIDPPSGILTLYSAISILLWSSSTNFFKISDIIFFSSKISIWFLFYAFYFSAENISFYSWF